MKLRSILFLAGLMLALSACSLADDIPPPPGYQSPVPQPTAGPVFPASLPDAAAGAAIYAEKCAPCHGVTGLGDGPQATKLPKKPTALGDPALARAAVPANWYNVVTEGRMDTFMPPFASLNDQQRWDVVAYAFSLSEKPAELGKTIYETNCAECHRADFSDQARMATLSLNDLVAVINQGIDPSMPAYAGKLSETEQYAAAGYIRTFTLQGPRTASPAGTLVAAGTSSAPLETPGAMGVISGKITNPSGTILPTDLKIVLHVFEHDAASGQFDELDTKETTVGSDGVYSFASLAMPTNYAYFISVDYGGTTYSSAPVVPAEGVSTYDLPLDIYDTTSDLSVLVADQVHTILDYSKPNIIQVVQYYAITNLGTKTVIPASKGAPLIKVLLPKGYTNLQFEDGVLGERFISITDGFGDTSPIPPSHEQFQLIFAFNLPYSTNFDFIEPFSLNVASTALLVSEGVTAQAPGIKDGGLKDMGDGGGTYQLYSVGSFKTGETLKVNITGAPTRPVSALPVAGTDSTRSLIIGVGALGIVLILAAVWLFVRDRKRVSTATLAPAASGANRTEIIDSIIALDDQFNAGNIAYEAYQKRRNELKEKLL